MIPPEVRLFDVTRIVQERTEYPGEQASPGFSVTVLRCFREGAELPSLEITLFSLRGGPVFEELPSRILSHLSTTSEIEE